MAKDSERLKLNIITPRGVAIYPKLNEPDTKFVPEGVYETRLRIDPAATDGVLGKDAITWADLLDAIDAQQAEFFAAKKKELAGGDGKAKVKAKSITSIEFGREADVDDDGNETGNVVIRAKMKASGVSKKDGKPWTRSPIIFDAKGKKLAEPPAIWGGSILKLAVEAAPYYNAKDNVVGTTLYLNAVQVLELVSGQGRTAEAYGFSAEDGYTTDDPEFGDTSGGSDGAEDF